MTHQLNLLSHDRGRKYRPVVSACENEKGVLDVDSVKGCSHGLARYGEDGCYGECYAKKTLHQRKFPKREQKIIVAFKGDLKKIKSRFATIGRL